MAKDTAHKPQAAFSVQRAEDSPGFLLWQVTQMWQRALNRVLKPLGLTHVQFVLMASIAWLSRQAASKAISQRALATHARQDVMMTSVVLRSLEKKGYVVRNPSRTDSRALAIELTQAGLSLVQKAIAAVEAQDAAFFETLGQENAHFRKMLLLLAQQTPG
jgi:DNA-binding MarR family transcriptional regulator